MLKAIIVDDETDAIASLKVLLEEFCADIEIAGTATTIKDGIKLINATNPDIAFLDIELTTGTGFELLEYFPERKFQVVFVTAYDSYALKAIKQHAFNYLLKPIDIDEMVATVQEIKQYVEKTEADNETKPGKKIKQQKISIFTNDGIIYLAVKDIIHIKAEGSYSTIYLRNEKPIMVSKNLKEFERLLENAGFFRIHNSHLINLKYVEKYFKADGGRIVMTDKYEIEVSRNKKDQFLAIMNKSAL